MMETLADNDQVTKFSDVVMDQAGLIGLICRLNGNEYHHQWQRKMRLQV